MLQPQKQIHLVSQGTHCTSSGSGSSGGPDAAAGGIRSGDYSEQQGAAAPHWRAAVTETSTMTGHPQGARSQVTIKDESGISRGDAG
jgi:hypothetical protein